MKTSTTEKAYGGFLELELCNEGKAYHSNALALSHGRACLAYILEQEKPKLAYVPFYTCGAMLDPLLERNIKLVYYAVDQNLDPVGLPDTPEDAALIIYINYFGLKSQTMERLTARYGNRLVADNCMSFFSQQYGDSYTYNSCRKFFGVPDGSYLYTPSPVSTQFNRYEGYRTDHLISRLRGDMDICYSQFLENEAAFDCGIYGMSLFTERLMGTIDYQTIADRRRNNFLRVHEQLGVHNRLQPALDDSAVPHYYPLLVANAPDRSLMAQDKLFVPTLWPDMLTRKSNGFEHEIDLAKNLLPLPIDQRYTTDDMEQMINVLKKYWTPA